MKFIKNYLGAAFLLFFLLFWSTLTLIFDCQTLRGMTEQLRTLSFQETQGQLLQSSVETHEDSDGGDMYRLAVQYRYQVGGTEYTSHIYRFGNLSSNDKFAHQRSEELASKTNVTVYYNPAIPQQAVLVRGIEGLDLFCLLFMTPFNMVMLAGWLALAIWFARFIKKPIAGGMKYSEKDGRVILKLHYKSMWATALVSLGGSAFLGVFIIAIPFGFHPALTLMIFVWAVIVALVGFFMYKSWQHNHSDENDFAIDDLQRTVSFSPVTTRESLQNKTVKEMFRATPFGKRVSVHRSQIENISIESKVIRDSDGNERTVYLPTISWQKINQAVLLEISDKECADDFVAWLRQRIGLTAYSVKRQGF